MTSPEHRPLRLTRKVERSADTGSAGGFGGNTPGWSVVRAVHPRTTRPKCCGCDSRDRERNRRLCGSAGVPGFKSYEVAIRNSLGFLISGIGTLSEETVQSQPVTGNHSAARSASDSGQGSMIIKATATTAGGESGTGNTVEQADANTGRSIAKKAAGNFIDIAWRGHAACVSSVGARHRQ